MCYKHNVLPGLVSFPINLFCVGYLIVSLKVYFIDHVCPYVFVAGLSASTWRRVVGRPMNLKSVNLADAWPVSVCAGAC